MFSLTLSRPLSVADVVALLAALAPPGLRLLVQPPGAEVPDDIRGVWVTLEPTRDPAWPLGLVVHTDAFDLGPYPDLRLAEHIAERFGADVLCGAEPSLAGVDPDDPYYALALVGGRWHLASTAFTRLHASGEEPDDEPVMLIRPVAVDTRRRGEHHWHGGPDQKGV
ncbi:hypothetical protein ABZX40_32110 [Streptomyces sp. NPDC004610]|uniref:hypothetical protein n=1 Tax=unclassified Streptomyces TaxID=2593676 RepID=UPI0033BE6ADC